MKGKTSKIQGISLILLLSILNGNILSMQKSNISQEVIKQIEAQYQDLSQNLNLGELNEKLKDILNRVPINRDDLEEAVELILAGANVNQKNHRGETALMLAAFNGHEDIAQLLIGNGANVNQKNNTGYTALMYAAIAGHMDIVQLLKDNVATVDVVNVNELNEKLSSILNRSPINRSGLEEAKKLILAGANVNQKNRHEETALILAAKYGHKDIVELLIGNGANVDAMEYYGNTALMWAAMNGHKNVAELLISNGANVNVENDAGNTALKLAIAYGHKDIIKLLEAAKNKMREKRLF